MSKRASSVVHRGHFGLVWFALGLALLSAGGCGGRGNTPTSDGKLVMIGVDAADWAHIDPLLADGRLPHLSALLAQSTAVEMLSFVPLEKSPILWASIATGRKPAEHGVGGFVREDEVTPTRADAWRAPALWDVVGAAGRESAVIGYWVTHPARRLRGVMVSDYLVHGRLSPAVATQTFAPDSLAELLLPEIVDPDLLPLAELARFIDLERLAGRERQYAIQLGELRRAYAADLSYVAVARRLARDNDFDLFVLYLRGLDLIYHKFWRHHNPEQSPTPLDEEEIAIFGGVAPRYLDFVDDVLGEVLSWFPPSRQVLVVSDHGFYGPRHRKRGWVLGTEEHRREGVFIVRSPAYRAGEGARVPRGSLELLDVAPTALALLGLPPSREMPGKILAAGLTGSGRRLVQRLERDRVATYQPLAPRGVGPANSDAAVDEAIRQQLRSLGYIK